MEDALYRLPTEAEWECACRAGSTTSFCFGSSKALLAGHAWYSGTGGRGTHVVGQKKSNAWGFHDMHGNVWEWCLDWYGSYGYGAQTDPAGPAEGTCRVLRGGSAPSSAALCRSTQRRFSPPGTSDEYYGLRVARPVS